MKRSEVNRDNLSPMMQQYMEIKDEYENELLLYRLGDFYELFFEDALIASRELELTLTGRVAGLEERVPMCGVPHHTVKSYIEKLVSKGYRVAIVEQLEDPKTAKGMVKRGVVDVFSKGTIADADLLNAKESSCISSLLLFDEVIVMCILDLSTSYLATLTIPNALDKLVNEIHNYNIKEVVVKSDFDKSIINILKTNYGIEISYNDLFIEDKYATLINKINDIRIKMGVKHLFYYVDHKILKDLSYITDIDYINRNLYLEMDIHTIRNLELTETVRLKDRMYSLIWLIDKCKTAMGSRKLKLWLLNPLKDKEKIYERYDKIEKLNNEFILKDELKKALFEIYDLERLTGKTINGALNPRDLIQLKKSLEVLPQIKEICQKLNFNYNINTHQNIYDILEKALIEDAPISLKEGGIIKDGYNQELDEIKSIRSGGKEFIAQFEEKIKNQTGIKNLKIGYNKVFGYYIEVSKGQKNLVKEEFKWERRQTLTNGERYISPELKEKEAMILNAEEKINNLEYDLFMEIKEIIKKEIVNIKNTADIISELDCLVALAVCSEEYNLIRPNLNMEHVVEIKNGRHPVVEIVNKKEYVPNDCILNKGINTLLITGPNMSGKSTFMRQLAIMSILAQMGSFVPATSANLPIFDKIFTRIGASDDLVSGESTFMVEMKEAKNAILNATSDSLILFDELGRGTATYDGISLAQGILEYISENIHAITLFSTHYHELTHLEKKYPNIKNVHVSAIEENNSITFLHKVKNGAIDKSYGIHVARLAGMPDKLLNRATDILNNYEKKKNNNPHNEIQLSLDFTKDEKDDEIKTKLKDLDVLNISPIEALNILYELKKDIDKDN